MFLASEQCRYTSDGACLTDNDRNCKVTNSQCYLGSSSGTCVPCEKDGLTCIYDSIEVSDPAEGGVAAAVISHASESKSAHETVSPDPNADGVSTASPDPISRSPQSNNAIADKDTSLDDTRDPGHSDETTVDAQWHILNDKVNQAAAVTSSLLPSSANVHALDNAGLQCELEHTRAELAESKCRLDLRDFELEVAKEGCKAEALTIEALCRVISESRDEMEDFRRLVKEEFRRARRDAEGVAGKERAEVAGWAKEFWSDVWDLTEGMAEKMEVMKEAVEKRFPEKWKPWLEREDEEARRISDWRAMWE